MEVLTTKGTIKGPDQDKPKILSETLHCGAPATKIKVVDKEARQKIVDENIKQLTLRKNRKIW